jgi:hypothetical protein
MAEPPGRGTLTTVWAPRKTYDNPVPNWTGGYAIPNYIMAEPQGRGAAGTYWDQRKTIPVYVPEQLGLGDDASNALRKYGDDVADTILSEVPKLPPAQREAGLKALFHAMEPGLLSRIAARMKLGLSPRDAISSAVQEGFGREIIRLGRGARPKALGYYGGGPEAMSGVLSTVKGWGETVLGKVGGIACKVAKSDVGPAIGGGVTTVYGGNPAIGVAGVKTAGSLCPKGQVPVLPPPPPSMFPPWVLPVAIGGVGLVAVILLTRKP